MSNFVGLIPIRLHSSRLPAKAMLTLSNGNSLIKHCVLRCRAFDIHPVICTDLASRDILTDHLKSLSVEVFVGALENKLKRLVLAAQHINVSNFHTVDPDDPFFCASQMKHSMKLLEQNASRYIRPSHYSDSGGATEGYSFNVNTLEYIVETEDSLDTSMVPPYLGHLEGRTMQNPDYAARQSRMTVDYIEDYEYVYRLSQRFDEKTPRPEIEFFINSENYFDNASMNEEWKKRQIAEMEK